MSDARTVAKMEKIKASADKALQQVDDAHDRAGDLVAEAVRLAGEATIKLEEGLMILYRARQAVDIEISRLQVEKRYIEGIAHAGQKALDPQASRIPQ